MNPWCTKLDPSFITCDDAMTVGALPVVCTRVACFQYLASPIKAIGLQFRKTLGNVAFPLHRQADTGVSGWNILSHSTRCHENIGELLFSCLVTLRTWTSLKVAGQICYWNIITGISYSWTHTVWTFTIWMISYIYNSILCLIYVCLCLI